LKKIAMRRHAITRGGSLLEILVGLTVGMTVCLAALGHFALSSRVDQALDEQSAMHMQAQHALDLIGSTLRQAGAIQALPQNGGEAVSRQYFDFSLARGDPGSAMAWPVYGTKSSSTGSDELWVSLLGGSSSEVADCLGAGGDSERVSSRFFVRGQTLSCQGSSNKRPQPMANGVDEFRVWFAIGEPAGRSMQWLAASDVGSRWGQILAVRICLRFVEATVQLPLPFRSHRNCDGVVSARPDGVRVIARHGCVRLTTATFGRAAACAGRRHRCQCDCVY
jgi:hypothetical protein